MPAQTGLMWPTMLKDTSSNHVLSATTAPQVLLPLSLVLLEPSETQLVLILSVTVLMLQVVYMQTSQAHTPR